MTRGMRHLDLTELLIKEKVEAKEIKLLKVASADNTVRQSNIQLTCCSHRRNSVKIRLRCSLLN